MAARRVFMLAKNIARYNACNIVDIEEWNILTNAFFNDLSNLSIITMIWLWTKHYFLSLIISNYTQIFQYSVISLGTFTLFIVHDIQCTYKSTSFNHTIFILISYQVDNLHPITIYLCQFIFCTWWVDKKWRRGPIYCHQNIWKYEWIIIKTSVPQTLNRVS